MKRATSEILFALVIAAAALFVVTSSRALPEMVGSHFGPSGAANGFMPHHFYVRFTLAFVVLLPVALNLLVSWLARLPKALVNIPNREYWMAPERRDVTVGALQQHMKLFGVLLVAFLCYVHWLVLHANELAPPTLDNGRFMMGLGAFMFALITWIVVMRRKFQLPGA